MNEELEVLKIVTESLNKANIEYMVTGSTAMNYYATPRMTRDIDVVLELQQEDLDKFIDLFSDDFYIYPEAVKNAIKLREMFNIIHNKYAIKIDFIVRKHDPYRLVEFERRRQINIEGVSVFIASAEDLILSKLWWGKDTHSAMQIGDVRNLIISVNDLDMQYVNKWIDELNLQDIYMEVQNA